MIDIDILKYKLLAENFTQVIIARPRPDSLGKDISDFLVEKIEQNERAGFDPQRQNLENLRKQHNGNKKYSERIK